jgi:hypothetical protein
MIKLRMMKMHGVKFDDTNDGTITGKHSKQ